MNFPLTRTMTHDARQRSTFTEPMAWMVVVVLTVFHIVATVGASMRVGRLAVIPTYDDVAYLVDGLNRLKAFDSGGLLGVLKSLAADPAHAPLTTLTATLGFALTPGQAVGSYALGGAWVVFFMILMAILLKRLPRLMLTGILMAFLAVPATGSVISEFRPDLSWGLLTGFAGVLLISTDLAKAERSALLGLGFLLGVDLIAKPTGSLPVLAVLGTAYASTVAASVFERRLNIKSLAVGTLVVATGAAIVVAPYFIVAGQEIVAYVHAVMVQDTGIWQAPGATTRDHLLFYERLAGLAMGWLWPSGLIIIGCYGASLLAHARKLTPDFIRWMGVVLMVAISYAIPTVAPVQSTFFGFIFYGPAVVASLWSLSFLLRSLTIPPLVVTLAGGAIFVLFWTPDPGYFPAKNPAVIATDQANRAIAPAILKVLASADPAKGPLLVLNISPGPIASHIMEYMARLKGLSGTFDAVTSFPNWDALVQRINVADINIVTETGALGQSPANFPIYAYQDKIVKTMQSDPLWHIIATYTDAKGFRTFVFSRLPSSPRLDGEVRDRL